MYTLNPSPKFSRKAKKLLKNNAAMTERLTIVFQMLEQDPFFPTLKTHKVHDINGALTYSSRLSSDIRIIWEIENGQVSILNLLDIGGHSGGKKVYS